LQKYGGAIRAKTQTGANIPRSEQHSGVGLQELQQVVGKEQDLIFPFENRKPA
jgi:hypothetical protein